MITFETIWRFLVTSLAVWRLSRVLFGGVGLWRSAEDAPEDRSAGRFWAGRAADFVCWISVWLSSQTAIWIACGFAGVFVSWLSMAGISRLLRASGETDGSALGSLSVEGRLGESSCAGCVDGLQARHG